MPVGMGINLTTPTQGHFVLSPVSLASRDQDAGPVELNDRHLRTLDTRGLLACLRGFAAQFCRPQREKTSGTQGNIYDLTEK